MTLIALPTRVAILDPRGCKVRIGDRVLISDPAYLDEGLEGVVQALDGRGLTETGEPSGYGRSRALVAFYDPQLELTIKQWLWVRHLEAVADLDPSCGPPVAVYGPYRPIVGDVVGGLESAPCGLAGKTGYIARLGYDYDGDGLVFTKASTVCQVVIDNGPIVWTEPVHLDLIYPAHVPSADDD